MNLVELIADESETYQSPCKFGNIVEGHACYCHSKHSDAPRKCPIWRNFGEYDLSCWKRGPWDLENCPYFVKAEDYKPHGDN